MNISLLIKVRTIETTPMAITRTVINATGAITAKVIPAITIPSKEAVHEENEVEWTEVDEAEAEAEAASSAEEIQGALIVPITHLEVNPKRRIKGAIERETTTCYITYTHSELHFYDIQSHLFGDPSRQIC